MRKLSKAVSCLLILLMLLNLGGVSVFAETQEELHAENVSASVSPSVSKEKEKDKADANSDPAPVDEPADSVSNEPATVDELSDSVSSNPAPADEPTDSASNEPATVDEPTDSASNEPATVDEPTDSVSNEPATVDEPTDSVSSDPAPVGEPADSVSSDPAPVDEAADSVSSDPAPVDELADGEGENSVEKAPAKGLGMLRERSSTQIGEAESEEQPAPELDADGNLPAPAASEISVPAEDIAPLMLKSALSKGNAAEGESKGESEDTGGSTNESEDESETSSKGDLTAKGDGLVLEGAGDFDILITGTLESGKTPVLIDESVSGDVSITVWKIEGSAKADGDSEEHLVLEKDASGKTAATDKAKNLEKAINYIIRIEPSQDNLIALDGTGTSHGYDVAYEGDTVTMKVTVPDGYTLTGAYTKDGEKTPLSRNANGDYFVQVPRGGGVFLGVELEKVRGETDTDSDSESADYAPPALVVSVSPVEDNTEASDEFRYSEIIFDFNGGTLNGDPGPLVFRVELGKDFTLLDAPVKPGARFVRWASSVDDIDVSMPGEVFVVTQGVLFVAVWEEEGHALFPGYEGEPYDDDDEDDDEDDGPDVKKTVRITQDNEEELNIGSIRVEGDAALGVQLQAAQDVDVDKDITVSGGAGGAVGVEAAADGRALKAEVETGDGMTVTSAGSSVGLDASASAGGSLDLKFDGSMKVASDSGQSVGVDVSTDAGSKAAVLVAGSVESDGTGAVLHADGGTVALSITD